MICPLASVNIKPHMKGMLLNIEQPFIHKDLLSRDLQPTQYTYIEEPLYNDMSRDTNSLDGTSTADHCLL